MATIDVNAPLGGGLILQQYAHPRRGDVYGVFSFIS
jgi:hypothetical protein